MIDAACTHKPLAAMGVAKGGGEGHSGSYRHTLKSWARRTAKAFHEQQTAC